ncbi:MAG: hypothetical protein ACREU3_02055 [Steroidobacteraceae bacterium]
MLAVVLGAWSASAAAASIQRLSVRSASGRYVIHLRAHLGVPAQAAYAVFANLRNLRAINPDVLQATIVGRSASGAVELYTVFQACVLWYCRSIREMQRMRFNPRGTGGEITATVVPGSGDLRSGQAQWSFEDAGGADAGEATELESSAVLTPAFHVPPLIGPWLVRRWLRAEAERAVTNIERLARSSARQGGHGAQGRRPRQGGRAAGGGHRAINAPAARRAR